LRRSRHRHVTRLDLQVVPVRDLFTSQNNRRIGVGCFYQLRCERNHASGQFEFRVGRLPIRLRASGPLGPAQSSNNQNQTISTPHHSHSLSTLPRPHPISLPFELLCNLIITLLCAALFPHSCASVGRPPRHSNTINPHPRCCLRNQRRKFISRASSLSARDGSKMKASGAE